MFEEYFALLKAHIVKMFMLLKTLISLGARIVTAITLHHVVAGRTMVLIRYLYEYIDSIHNPTFLRFRRCVKLYMRMMFWNKIYNRGVFNEETIRKGNTYIDKLLEDMFENNDEYDPYVLEDSVVGFQKKVMFVNVTGEAKLHDGYIKKLRTLHRVKPCSLHDEGNKLRVKADLGAGELEFHYKGSAKFMNFGPTITIQGTLSYIEVHMEFRFNSKTGREGKLAKFIIDDMRGMKVRVTGLGPINWAVNPIISGVTKIFKRFVRNFMENKVENYIREHISNYQFPIEGEITEAPEPKTETPEETPETEAPEETPETEAPEETPETEAPEETPETEAPEEMLESDTEEEMLESDTEEEINLPETPDSSIADEISNDASEPESESSNESYIPDSDADSENNFI